MAKIGDLQIGSDKIADGAVVAVVETTTPSTNTLTPRSPEVPPFSSGSDWILTLAITNPQGNPVQLFMAMNIDFPGNGVGSGDQATQVQARIKMTRTRDSKLMYDSGTIGPYLGNSHRAPSFSAQTIDMDAGASESYALDFHYVTDGTTVVGSYPDIPTFGDSSFFAIVTKR
jgi:hypothetical protein